MPKDGTAKSILLNLCTTAIFNLPSKASFFFLPLAPPKCESVNIFLSLFVFIVARTHLFSIKAG